MTWFKMLMGFTLLNVVLQLVRGNDALDVAVAVIIFFMTLIAWDLWEQTK